MLLCVPFEEYTKSYGWKILPGMQIHLKDFILTFLHALQL